MAQRGILNSWSIMGLAVLAGLVIVAGTGTELWAAHDRDENHTLREAGNLANVGDTQIRTQVRLAEDALRGFSQRAMGPDGFKDTASLASDASLILSTHAEVTALILTGEDGRTIFSTVRNPEAIFDWANFVPQYDATEAGSNADYVEIGRLQRNTPSTPWFIPIRRSLHDASGALVGYDYALLRPQALTSEFESLTLGRFNAASVQESDGIIVARFPDAQKFVGRSLLSGAIFQTYLPRAPVGALRLRGVLNRRDLYVAYRTVPGTPFIINIAYDANRSLEDWVRRVWLDCAIVLVLLLLIGATAWLVRRDHLRQLSAVAAQQSRDIIGGMASVVALADGDGRILDVNQAFLDLAAVKRTDAVGRKLWELPSFHHAGEKQNRLRALFEAALSGRPARSDVLFRAKGSEFGVLDTAFRPLHDRGGGEKCMILSGVDVTERRNLELRLGAAQRMEAIGLVASEIAHDFSNYIAAIGGFAEFLAADGDDSATRISFAQRILRVCNTARQTISQILSYGRSQDAEKSEIELRTVLRDVETMVHPTIAAPVGFELDLPDSDVFVAGNAGQMTQIFVNLCTNARDAMAGCSGTVRLEMTCVPAGAPDHPATLEPAAKDISLSLRQMGDADPALDYAKIVVTDEGEGIDNATLARIFEPFYTTKPRGRGTGLGLAIIHGLVLSLNGVYRLESRPGFGTTFAVYLPARFAARTSLAA